jgi:hypothetical protein
MNAWMQALSMFLSSQPTTNIVDAKQMWSRSSAPPKDLAENLPIAAAAWDSMPTIVIVEMSDFTYRRVTVYCQSTA